ncbi:MAG: hypothetical protein F9K39_11495 [Exiguobacterium chiriqhucha]|uniref:hypothetical protein n=1 Tax=Exiguobacterium chiriqhucha TaxID=1385984 RepID=UPI001450185F|nr:hypothetical protein [Exiguobacterium chiriqhucha]KAB2862155.1 MAG: hypothetical protein F9K39_11495 [Exiguobacterium chiriqhucha]
MFALLIGIDLFFNLGTIQNELNLFYAAAILFALRYGTIFGLISFGILLLYKVLYTGLMGGDIFLLFYDTNSLLTLFYYFAITVIVVVIFIAIVVITSTVIVIRRWRVLRWQRG